jgi:hypothetical protein
MTPEGAIMIISGIKVLVDIEDVDRINASSPWRKHRGSQKQYFVHSAPRPEHKNILLHRYIMSAPDGLEVDHINGNTLDNRKSNLRICQHKENMRNVKLRRTNRSGYKGVSFDVRRNKWKARITLNSRENFLGYFETPQGAYGAYCKAVKKYHGEFGRV